MTWGAKEERLRTAREAAYALVLAALMALLVIQLFSLQVSGHRRYLAKSFGNKIQAIPLLAPRGEIYDRAGRPLAVNRVAYALNYFPPEGDPAEDEALKYIARWLGTGFTALAESVARQKAVLYAYQPVTIASRMTLAQVAYVEENRHLFPGCFVETNNFVRYYPLGAAATHLVGYTALIAEDELEAKKAAGYLANEFVGKTGVEHQFESILRGGLGSRYIEVDRNRFFKRIVVERPPVQGQDLYLTIDARLQQAAYDVLGGRRGAVIIMEPKSGEVLALVSSPSFDANRFREADGADYLSHVADDDRFPMLNRAVSNGYAPGSVVKHITMVGALETGKVSAGSTFYCPGYLDVGIRKFYCWQREGHGTVGMVDALGKSCDVAYYTMGLKLGEDSLRHFYEEFGLGRPTGIELPTEARGLVPSREWKRKHYAGERYNEVDRMWYDGDTANLAIGQGYLLATPLQVLNAMNIIVNGGEVVRPTLLKGVERAGKVEAPRRDPPAYLNIDSATIELVKRGLRRSALPGGTAEILAGLKVSVAGKTGTAETWGGEPHSWFAGYFPASDPRVSLVVFFENGGSSHDTAVPAAKQLIARVAEILDL